MKFPRSLPCSAQYAVGKAFRRRQAALVAMKTNS